ncbi:MAG: S49 family peptidase [bacterium]|nr:S49 family peptidase [bacterium]
MSSNKACCWILGIFAGGFVLTVLVIGWGISQAVSGGFKGKLSSHTSIEPNTWLVLRPTGTIPEYNVDPDLGFLGGSGGSSLNDMLRAIQLAQDDPNISGIVLRPMGVTGMATIRELREALLSFKQGDKPIITHFDIATDRAYYLASVSDSIFMMPGRLSGVNFGGMEFSSTYLKSTFEKVGLKFHVIHAGKYKGAFEDFARDSMSTELRTSLTYLYSDVYDTYVRETANARSNLTFEALDHEVRSGDQFLVSAASCLNRGYVDGLVDWPVLRSRLQKDSKEFEGVSAHKYLASKKLEQFPTHESEVAVVFAQGEISFGDDESGWGEDGITASGMVKQLDKLGEDENVKAVVIRVDSPGGSALASKQILEAALRLKEKKPIVVSMGRVAASRLLHLHGRKRDSGSTEHHHRLNWCGNNDPVRRRVVQEDRRSRRNHLDWSLGEFLPLRQDSWPGSGTGAE